MGTGRYLRDLFGVALLPLLLVSGPVGAASERGVVIVSDQSSVTFEGTMWGFSPVPGRFGPVTGRLCLSNEGRVVNGAIQIDATQVAVKDEAMTAVLRGDRLFAVDAHPNVFVSVVGKDTSAAVSEAVVSHITLKGVTRPLIIDVGKAVPIDAKSFWVRTDAEISRDAFEMGFGWPVISDLVTVKINLLVTADPSSSCAS